MDEVNYRRCQGIFLQALELPPEERDRWLGSMCEEDLEFRNEVNALLEHEASSREFFQTGVAGEDFHVAKFIDLFQNHLNSIAANPDLKHGE